MSTQTPPPHPVTPEPTVGAYVGRRVKALLNTLDTSGTRASLAHLRHAVMRKPGEVPEIWSLTIDGVPGHPHDDEPTRQERAVHAALTLFAVHQQSRSTPAHRPGVGLGQAVRRLEGSRPTLGSGDVSPVRRRFDALVLSDSFVEATYHLRGLVNQLRAESVPLDYGALADDLALLQVPGRASEVHLRWARQYYRSTTASDETADADDPTDATTDAAATVPEEDLR